MGPGVLRGRAAFVGPTPEGMRLPGPSRGRAVRGGRSRLSGEGEDLPS